MCGALALGWLSGMKRFVTCSRITAGTGIALALLVLCAAVGSHVVLHDLHGESHHAAGPASLPDHEHDHPVTPQVSARHLVALSLASMTIDELAPAVLVPALPGETASSLRNVVSAGALRADEDVGLQPLLSTWLI